MLQPAGVRRRVTTSSIVRSGTPPLDRGQFFGRVLQRRDAAGLVLSETRHPAGGSVPAHAHAGALVTLVIEGLIDERVGRRADLCESGSVVFHPAGESHANSFGAHGARCFNVQLADGWLERTVDGGGSGVSTQDRVVRPSSTVTGQALALRREAMVGDALPLALEGRALLLLASLLDRSSEAPRHDRYPAWVGRAEEQLRESAAQPPSTELLAAEAGVHPVHFTRVFRAYAGCTPGEFVRRRRIEWACERLRRSTVSLSDVAHAAGFSDQSHFTRIFRRIVGVTPGAYRRAIGAQ
jgi:AraC family transcriptional regulator